MQIDYSAIVARESLFTSKKIKKDKKKEYRNKKRID
jgi:hypothetical protein